MTTKPTRDLIRLQNEDLVLTVNPQLGASIDRFYIDNGDGPFDLMRPTSRHDATLVETIAEDAVLNSACYPLVPYSGRISNAEFEFQGHRVREPTLARFHPHAIHGHGWRRPWTIVNNDTNRVTLAYHHAEDHWPWEYTARQTMTLNPDGLRIVLSIHNCSQTAMPAGLGLHPFFPKHGNARIETKVDGMWQANEDVLPVEHVAIESSHSYNGVIDPSSTVLDNVFSGWSGVARINWPDANTALELRAATDYLIIYTPQGEDYFCVEPATHPADSFKHLNPKHLDPAQANADDPLPTVHNSTNDYQIIAPMATLGITVDFNVLRTNVG